MAENEYLLEFYLEAGGDPNLRSKHGVSLLTRAICIATDFLEKRPSDEEELLVKETSEGKLPGSHISAGQDVEDKDYQRCTRLFVLLIAAGADIYEVVAYPKSAKMLTELASDSGVRSMWDTALEECGFNVRDVYAESDRRLREFQRIRGAERTGVDVQVLQENDSSTGLRYRGRRTVTDT